MDANSEKARAWLFWFRCWIKFKHTLNSYQSQWSPRWKTGFYYKISTNDISIFNFFLFYQEMVFSVSIIYQICNVIRNSICYLDTISCINAGTNAQYVLKSRQATIFFKWLYCFKFCVYMRGEFMWLQVPTEARGIGFPWSWNCKWLGVT